MRQYWLVVVDTTQIQPYIFGSNRLQENIGASWLVKQATGPWALQLVSALKSNVKDAQQNQLDDRLRIEDGNLEAEVIYAGGGNVLILFADESKARDFIRRLSRKALCEAPGLQLLFAKQSVDWDARPAQLFDCVMRAFKDLEAQKAQRAPSAPLLGLGVTAACRSTGLPASVMRGYAGEAPQPISAEIKAKLDAAEKAHKELTDQFRGVIGGDYHFPKDFDDMGREEGEQSFIAVIHADGNGFGQAMIEIGRHNKHDNRAYIEAVRRRSQAVGRASMQALGQTLDLLWRCIIRDSDEKEQPRLVRTATLDDRGNKREEVVARITLKRDSSGRWFFPFRPLVYGGDDVTFVCDGRLGVSLAVEYLTQFEAHATRELGEWSSASAGVAIVKAHYPFARAYGLADDLCRSAKRFRAQEQERTRQEQGSYLDWHFAVGGLVAELGDIRQREYQTKEGHLCLRPLSLNPELPTQVDVFTARRWGVFEKALSAFQGTEWATRRNKVKALRDALRQGEKAVERFCLIYLDDSNKLPALTGDDKGIHRETGWLPGKDKEKSRCAYFDAIELADVYMPLVQHPTAQSEAHEEVA
jgi:hypothetical protein